MLSRVDGLIHRDGREAHQIAKVTGLPGAGQSQLLIEIAVIKMALPIHTQQLTAHHRLKIYWVVCFLQKGLVSLQVATEFQLPGEPLNGHVGQRQQTIEPNAQPGQCSLVISLQSWLGRRQHRSKGVVDKIQLPPGITRSVAQGIELPQATDAAFKNTITPLAVDVLGAVTGQGGCDANPLVCKEFSQILLAGFTQDREIAAVNHSGSA